MACNPQHDQGCVNTPASRNNKSCVVSLVRLYHGGCLDDRAKDMSETRSLGTHLQLISRVTRVSPLHPLPHLRRLRLPFESKEEDGGMKVRTKTRTGDRPISPIFARPWELGQTLNSRSDCFTDDWMAWEIGRDPGQAIGLFRRYLGGLEMGVREDDEG